MEYFYQKYLKTYDMIRILLFRFFTIISSVKSGVVSYFDLNTCLFSKLYIGQRHNKNVTSSGFCVKGKRDMIVVEVLRDCCMLLLYVIVVCYYCMLLLYVVIVCYYCMLLLYVIIVCCYCMLLLYVIIKTFSKEVRKYVENMHRPVIFCCRVDFQDNIVYSPSLLI